LFVLPEPGASLSHILDHRNHLLLQLGPILKVRDGDHRRIVLKSGQRGGLGKLLRNLRHGLDRDHLQVLRSWPHLREGDLQEKVPDRRATGNEHAVVARARRKQPHLCGGTEPHIDIVEIGQPLEHDGTGIILFHAEIHLGCGRIGGTAGGIGIDVKDPPLGLPAFGDQ